MALKDTLSRATSKLSQTVGKNRDAIQSGVDKAARYASKRTRGRYDSAIQKGSQRVSTGLDNLAAREDKGPGGSR